MPLQFNQFVLALMAGGGGAAAPLRFVTAGNSVGSETRTHTGAMLGVACKDIHYIGSGDVDGLYIEMNNWAIGQTVFNAVNVMEMWVTVDGQASGVAVRWSGSTTTTVPSAAVRYQSDRLLPSDFGLPTFARGTKLHIGYRLQVTTAGHVMPSVADNSATVNSSIFYTPGSATISNLQGSGAMTYGGTVAAVGDTGFPLHIVGTFVGGVDPAVYAGIGDSITVGVGSTTNNYLGYFYRALFDNIATFSNPRAGVNISRTGTNAVLWSTAPGIAAKLAEICKLANIFVERYGINSIASNVGQPGADAIIASRKINIWDLIRANPASGGRSPKICALPLTPKVNHTASVSSISGSGTVATLTTTTTFVSSIGGIGATRVCTIAGATPAGYNATSVTVTVASTTTVTYTNATTGASSGTITITDKCTTLVNQTPMAGCGIGEQIALLDTTMASITGTAAGPDYYVDNTEAVRGNSSKASADYWRWGTTGYADDGLHPNPVGHEAMAIPLRTWMQAQ